MQKILKTVLKYKKAAFAAVTSVGGVLAVIAAHPSFEVLAAAIVAAIYNVVAVAVATNVE